MTPRVYLSDATKLDGWVRLDLPARRGTDSMRVWLLQHVKVQMLGPLPLSEVPEGLRPAGCRWSATAGRTTKHGYVLVITDDQDTGVGRTHRSTWGQEQQVPGPAPLSCVGLP